MKNLWKDLELLESDLQNPVELVKEQAEYLQEGTEGFLSLFADSFGKMGMASTKVIKNLNFKVKFKYNVSLRSSYLSEYKYNIFLCIMISHFIRLY